MTSVRFGDGQKEEITMIERVRMIEAASYLHNLINCPACGPIRQRKRTDALKFVVRVRFWLGFTAALKFFNLRAQLLANFFVGF